MSELENVLHGPRGPVVDAVKDRRCAECLAAVDTSKEWRKMFCTEEHRQAFHNRQLKRGRKLVVLAMAARITRGGHRRRKEAGRTARHRAEKLMDGWWMEDREAGRMSMDEYLETRERLGFHD
jgi:hypothetical protein